MDTMPSATSVRFLSTPSARRATDGHGAFRNQCEISIHALREEGDGNTNLGSAGDRSISIHALREEGDVRKSGRPDRHRRVISIHALREEGD